LAPGRTAPAPSRRTVWRSRSSKRSSSIQYPKSDSTWAFVSYEGFTEVPDAATFEQVSGYPVSEEGDTYRLNFDATLDRLATVEPWRDEGQKRSARGFRKLQGMFHRELGDDLPVYHCETGTAEVYIYFVGVDGDRLAGLLTVSIETSRSAGS
jgi:hypothetical protein